MQKILVDSLILDFNIYPRASIDSHHVIYMEESLESGCEFPAVIADKKSKRVIDGFHRITAVRKFCKKNGITKQTIPVVFKTYKNDGEMFLDSMRYNSSHGKNLVTFDRTHCIIKSEEFGLKPEDVSKALSITVSKYQKLKTTRIGSLSIASGMPGHNKKVREPIQLKRTIKHMAGQTLTKGQALANRQLSGLGQSFYVNQIILLIENNLLNPEDDYLMDRLQELYKLLTPIVKTKMAV